MSVVADAPRITDREHRIEQDPSSIAFAQLAEAIRPDRSTRIPSDSLPETPARS